MTTGNMQPSQGPQMKDSIDIESVLFLELENYYKIKSDKLINYFDQAVSSVLNGNNSEFRGKMQEGRGKLMHIKDETQKKLRMGIEQVKNLSTPGIRASSEKHLRESALSSLSQQEEIIKNFLQKWVPGYK